jgi:hypothetical protein
MREMSRVFYDSSKYYEEKAKLQKADGIHCIVCGKLFERPDKRKSYCSQKCFSNWYYSIGVKSWPEIRDQVIKRDGKCVKCGIIGPFEVHHVKPICEGGEEFNPDNCITLCYDCHKEMHNINGNKKRHNHSIWEFASIDA